MHLFYDPPPPPPPPPSALTVPDFIFILHPTADLHVEVIHDNIDTDLECVPLPTIACAKLPFI